MTSTVRLADLLQERYRVHHEIGRGGMATVYLAEDLKHQRRVAIKVLHPELGAILGVERFLSEIRVTASLQHPNILPLFDSGASDGLVYYVMPFVEGETLRARIAREHQLPIGDVVRIVRAAATALDYAHRHGIIHRDIKPENILLVDGQPLIADFGIARAVTNAAGERMTQSGISVGTPQYMSPEQASAERQLDGRSDIYSLAAVAYEMLTGEPPFTGPDAPAIVAKLMTEPVPDVRLRRKSVPSHVAAAVHRGLERIRADRFLTAAEFAEAVSGPADSASLADVVARPSGAQAPLRVLRRTGKPALLVLGGLVAGTLLVNAIGETRQRVRVVRASIPMDESPISVNGQYGNVAISRDGNVIAYRQSAGIFVRSLDQAEARLLPGTRGAALQAFSPDGRQLAFIQQNRLKTMPVSGGPMTDLGPFGTLGVRWEEDGYIYGVRTGIARSGIWRRPAKGGEAEAVTHIDSGSSEVSHAWPEVLPRQHAIIYTVLGPSGGSADSRVVVERLDTHERSTLVDKAIFGRLIATGHLIYAINDGNISAARFDKKRLALVGEPQPLLASVATASWGGAAFLDVSEDGTLIYLPRSSSRLTTLHVYDRTGRLITTLPGSESSQPVSPNFGNPRWAPDGRRIAVTGRDYGQSDVWVLDTRTWNRERFTFEATEEEYPIWSPDGQSVAYTAADPGAARRILLKSTVTGAGARVLRKWPRHAHVTSWTPDGAWMALYEYSPLGIDVWAIRVGGGNPLLVAGGPANEVNPVFSPDGRWLAYQSNESGRPEIYAVSFPDLNSKFQLSTDGGAMPRWDAGGRTLYYARDGSVIAQAVDTRTGLRKGTLQRLFSPPFSDFDFDVSADGSRFIVVGAVVAPTTLHVILNWSEEVHKHFRKSTARR